MKLCRFEQASTSGQARSGIVYGGKVYETDGANPIAVHESADVRLLTPIGQPPSVRFFWCYDAPPVSGANLASQLDFVYLNPASLLPPVGVLKKPTLSSNLTFDPCVALVVATPGANIPVEAAEEHVLGYMLAVSFADEHMEATNVGLARYSARWRDMGTAIGPAITTPDEIEEAVSEHGSSKRYQIPVTARVDGREVGAWNTGDLSVSISEVVSLASESCMLQAGDVICIKLPAMDGARAIPSLDRGDEVQILCDRLGSLLTVVA